MAKRRNQKKEKALRNQAYARKFRKRTNTGRFGRRYYNDNRSEAKEGDQENDNQDIGMGATDTK
jgi:hypothetical protein